MSLFSRLAGSAAESVDPWEPLGSPAEAARDRHADRPARRSCASRTSTTPAAVATSPGAGRRAPPDRADDRRHLQRPRASAHGRIGSAFRPQRPARRDVYPEPEPSDPGAEPAHGQPRAADARRVHAGDDAERARGRVAPVRGARLVQPREERDRRARGRSRSTDDDPWPEQPDADPADAARPDRPDDGTPADVSSPPTRTGGTRSQIYGSDAGVRSRVRTREDGKLRIDARRPAARATSRRTSTSPASPGTSGSGSALLHTLFTLRAQRDLRPAAGGVPDLVGRRALRPGAADQRRADGEDPHRRVDAGDHRPPDDRARDARELVGPARRAARHAVRRRTGNEVVSGIPGSPTDHHGVPYSLTEEFVAVYRMHPLLPDDYTFRSLARRPRAAGAHVPRDRRAARRASASRRSALADALYSFGLAHPGAIRLHNYPRFLQQLRAARRRACIDLAATDILRIRERGVPRYNEFRRLLPPEAGATSFEELTDNAGVGRGAPRASTATSSGWT